MAEQEYLKIDYYIRYKGFTTKQVAAIKRKRTCAIRKLQLAEDECRAFEEELDLASRWMRGMPEYEEAVKELAMREYYKAVDELEWLVVQRLFELTKLGMSGVGEYYVQQGCFEGASSTYIFRIQAT